MKQSGSFSIVLKQVIQKDGKPPLCAHRPNHCEPTFLQFQALFHHPAEHRMEKVSLGTEVVANQRMINLGQLADHAKSRVLVRVSGENLYCCVQDLFPGLLPSCLLAASIFWRYFRAQ